MKKNTARGFTYIDLILYIAIVSLMLTTLVPFAWNIIEGGSKSSTQEELSSTARYVSERLLYEIRNAKGIDVSNTTFGQNIANSGKFALLNFAPTNTTSLTISSGILQITQGTNQPVSLNSTNTKITNLVFTNFSSADGITTQHVFFTLTIQAAYPSGRQEFQGSETIQANAEIRSH